MPKKQKPIDEARKKLTEKLEEVKTKANKLHDIITTISNEAIGNAEVVLKETSKTKFLNKYSKASQDLECCLSKFLLVSDALVSLEESSSDEEGSEESGDDAEDENKSQHSGTEITTTTQTETTAKCEVSEVTTTRTITPEIKDTVEELQNLRRDSADSFFSSVSTAGVKQRPQKTLNHEVTVETFKWETDVAYPVLITNFISPWEFHLQIFNPENDIMEKMCIEFMKEATNGYKGGIDVIPSVGMFCCAKSTDGSWYRAKIVEVYKNNGNLLDGVTVKVFFLDEGFYAIVGLIHIRPLAPKYATMLPAQSLHCILGGVQPSEALKEQNNLSFTECSRLWASATSEWFQQMIDDGTLFNAYCYFPPKAAYVLPHNIDKDVLACDLYIHDRDQKEIKLWSVSYIRPPIESHVAFMMIIQNMACYCAFFNSELNRKKAQRAIKEAKEKAQKNESSPKLDMKPKSLDLGVSSVTSEEKKPFSTRRKTDTATTISKSRPKSECEKERKVKSPTPVKTKDKTTKDSQKHRTKTRTSESSPESTHQDVSGMKKKLDQRPTEPKFELLPNVRNPIKTEPAKRPHTPNDHQFSDVNSAISSPVAFTSNTVDKKPFTFLLETDNNNKSFPDNSKEQKSTTPAAGTDGNITPYDVGNVIAVEEMTNFKFASIFVEMDLKTNCDTFIKIAVSEVVNPGLFYVHLLVSPEVAKLDEMMDELNSFYDIKSEEIRKHAPVYTEGMAVAAKFPADDKWYRAIIVSKVEQEEQEEQRAGMMDSQEERFSVLYVDFGTSEVIEAKNILPICQEFCALPMETIPCELADVEPHSPYVSSHKKEPSLLPAGIESESDSQDSKLVFTSENGDVDELSKWSEACITRMRTLVLDQVPLMLSLKRKEKNANGLFEVYLYDTTNGKDLFVNQLLIDEDLATSKVFSKKTPTVRINEADLEEKDEELAEIDRWDPMKEQHSSDRNAYSVDVNDPGVAMLGYVEKPKNICHQYFRGRCYRGADCRFAHVKPGETPQEFAEVFCDDNVTDLPAIGEWAPVTVTALMHPSHFWVNFPCGTRMFCEEKSQPKSQNEYENIDKLNQLNEEMNEYYTKLKKREEKTDLSILAEGELVAADFEDCWYRARIVSAAEDLVQVYYVDYGNTAVVEEKNIRKLSPDFLHLPLQAVECRLHNVNMEENLKEKNLVMYSKLRDEFTELTADKLLMVQIIASSPRKELIVDLYDTSTNPHQHLNELVSSWQGMVRETPTDPSKKRTERNEKVAKQVMYPG